MMMTTTNANLDDVINRIVESGPRQHDWLFVEDTLQDVLSGNEMAWDVLSRVFTHKQWAIVIDLTGSPALLQRLRMHQAPEKLAFLLHEIESVNEEFDDGVVEYAVRTLTQMNELVFNLRKYA